MIRKQIGYGWIARQHAEAFESFYRRWLNPYLNHHRPCGFARIRTGKRGKRKRVYPQEDYQTPYEKLRSLTGWEGHRKRDYPPDNSSSARWRIRRQNLPARCSEKSSDCWPRREAGKRLRRNGAPEVAATMEETISTKSCAAELWKCRAEETVEKLRFPTVPTALTATTCVLLSKNKKRDSRPKHPSLQALSSIGKC